MRNLLIKTVLVAITFVYAVQGNAAVINGSGMISTVSYDVPEYKQLVVDGKFDVVLNYGLETGVSVKTDENLQHLILIDASDNTLYIRTKEDIGDASELTLYVTVSSLEQMGFNNVLSIHSEEAIWFNNLELVLNTIGTSKLHFAGNELSVIMEGSGDLELTGRVNSVNIDNKGIGAIMTGKLSSSKLTVTTTERSKIQMQMTAEKEKSFKTLSTVKPVAHPKA
jgi:hypothetical protein